MSRVDAIVEALPAAVPLATAFDPSCATASYPVQMR